MAKYVTLRHVYGMSFGSWLWHKVKVSDANGFMVLGCDKTTRIDVTRMTYRARVKNGNDTRGTRLCARCTP